MKLLIWILNQAEVNVRGPASGTYLKYFMRPQEHFKKSRGVYFTCCSWCWSLVFLILAKLNIEVVANCKVRIKGVASERYLAMEANGTLLSQVASQVCTCFLPFKTRMLFFLTTGLENNRFWELRISLPKMICVSTRSSRNVRPITIYKAENLVCNTVKGHTYPFAFFEWERNESPTSGIRCCSSNSVLLLQINTHRFVV